MRSLPWGCVSRRDPLSRGFTATSSEAPPAPPYGALVVWLIALAVVGFVVWLAYTLIAIQANACSSGQSFRTGGAASGGSLLTAVVVSAPLWLAAGAIAFRAPAQTHTSVRDLSDAVRRSARGAVERVAVVLAAEALLAL